MKALLVLEDPFFVNYHVVVSSVRRILGPTKKI